MQQETGKNTGIIISHIQLRTAVLFHTDSVFMRVCYYSLFASVLAHSLLSARNLITLATAYHVAHCRFSLCLSCSLFVSTHAGNNKKHVRRLVIHQ